MFALRSKPAPRPTIETRHLPAPLGGINTVAAGSAIPATDCIHGYNVIAAEYGLRSRLGWREWCTTLTGAADNTVRSMLPFTGSVGSKSKLFAVTSTGIWGVTASSTTPTQVLTFPSSAGNAGRGVSHVVVTAAGHFLAYADEQNGLYVYTESTDTWAQSTITGVDVTKLVFVTVWKNRLMAVERDTGKAWYLAAGAITGAATSFDFSGKFKAGGHLVGLWSWTYDGGAGMDDSLVAISSGGDVAIYQGTDIAGATTFGLKGVWYVGAVPAGRRIATDSGGDLLLLSTLGALPLSRLVTGANAQDSRQYATAKITNLFSSLASTYRTVQGWALHVHPTDNALLVLVPSGGQSAATEQLAMSFSTQGWSRYRDLPIYSACVWEGDLYFGTADGKVCRNDVPVDGVTLVNPSSYTAVECSLLSGFSNLGNARQKQVQVVRPTFLSQTGNVSFSAEARYGYDLDEASDPTAASAASGTWDNGNWDSAVWGGDYSADQTLRGGSGMGRDVAIAMKWTATTRTTLVGVDVMFTQGGVL